jgi:hypothetical protein
MSILLACLCSFAVAAPVERAATAPATSPAAGLAFTLSVGLAASSVRTPPGTTSTNYALLKNYGTTSITVTEVDLVNDRAAFSLSGAYPPFVLAPGGSRSFTVDFRPPAEGVYSGTIRVRSADGEVNAGFRAAGDASAPVDSVVSGLLGTPVAVAHVVGGTATMSDSVTVQGALDKPLIDSVIKRNMNQLRYCYQRELTRNPDLGGKLTVKFVIAGDGTVSTAETAGSTLANAAVEQCINGRFLKFQFPAPKGGGIVIVSYPFTFAPE